MSEVLIEISGGLGNQLFQLSAAKYLQNFYPNVSIDCSPNKLNRARKNEISDFARILDIKEYQSSAPYVDLVKLRYKLTSRFPYLKSLEVEKSNFSVPRFISRKSFVRYRGYWQNSINAGSLKSHLRDYIKPVKNSEVGMHVRKGDYLDPKHGGLHGELPNVYFTKAIEEIGKITESRDLAIYSD